MPHRHLTPEEKQTIKKIAEEAGFADVLLLLGGLIRNAVPNTVENWQNGMVEWSDDVFHRLTKVRHEVYNKIDNPEKS